MQHFRLSLEGCGHPFYVTAVDFLGVDDQGQPKPFAPNYVDREFTCSECREISKATEQKRVGWLGA